MRYLALIAVLACGCGGSDERIGVDEFALMWADGWCHYEAACGIEDACPVGEWASIASEVFSCHDDLDAAWAEECRAAIIEQGCSLDVPPVCQLEVCP